MRLRAAHAGGSAPARISAAARGDGGSIPASGPIPAARAFRRAALVRFIIAASGPRTQPVEAKPLVELVKVMLAGAEAETAAGCESDHGGKICARPSPSPASSSVVAAAATAGNSGGVTVQVAASVAILADACVAQNADSAKSSVALCRAEYRGGGGSRSAPAASNTSPKARECCAAQKGHTRRVQCVRDVRR